MLIDDLCTVHPGSVRPGFGRVGGRGNETEMVHERITRGFAVRLVQRIVLGRRTSGFGCVRELKAWKRSLRSWTRKDVSPMRKGTVAQGRGKI